jgi:ribosomal protein L7/L12
MKVDLLGYTPLALFVALVVAVVGFWLLRRGRRGDTLEVGSPSSTASSPGPTIIPPAATTVPRPSPANASSADEVAKLWALRQQGALTEAEFEAQKARVLAGEAPGSGAGGRQLLLVSAGINKIAVIKRYRQLTNCGLKEALDRVQSAPALLADNLDDATAERLRADFASDGAEVEVR